MSEPRAIVAGGGPVGLALACALRGFDVHVIEPATPQVPGEALDLRVLALSPGTRELLRDLGAWERIDGARLAAVKRMEIFGDAGARLAFSSRPGAALAWIVEASRLAFALREQAVSMGITVHAQRAKAYGAQASGAWAELEDGARIEGEILVGADGPDSQVRGATAIASEERPYPEAAIVAHFETGEPHGGVARQWFRDDGVLAWLPLPGKRISIVWSAPSHHADAFMAEAGADFERRVRDAGQAALGDMKLISPLGRFALRSIEVAEPVAPGVALVGDAAHAIHPLAGQGVNLGFRDAVALAETLASRTALERPGDPRVLRRYSRARREDVTAMHFVTEGLDRLFASGGPGARVFRNLGLRLVDTQDWAKSALADRAMR
ncbi:MAG TPA: FAD-dependent monooxygenase [Usitatibacter sp.]|nr:FAD-dependent monooxygenase [Usitatibacter sp.]